MKNLRGFLDTKHGIFIGRVYMLLVLFIGNALMALGAALYFNYGHTMVMMAIGIIITIASIAILSTPVDLGNAQNTNADTDSE